MKKLLLAVLLLLITGGAYAQNTPWSTSGNIGIGTTTPANTLDVVGTGSFSSNLALGGNLKMSATSPLVQIFNTSAYAVGNVIRTQYVFNNSLGAFVDVSTSNNTSTPLVDFIWNTYNGSQFAGVMTLKSTGRLLLGQGTVNGSTALLQVTTGNSSNAPSAITASNFSGASVGIGGFTSIGGFIQAGNVITSAGAPLFLQPFNSSVLIGSTTPTLGAEELQVTGSVNVSSNLLVRGNVGIGTTDPLNKLHIYSATSADGLSIDGNNNPSIVLRSNGAIKGYAPGIVTGTNGYFIGSVAGDMAFRSEGYKILFGTQEAATTMAISGGNVGIGTINPDTKLAVNGTIHATAIKVDAIVPTPDYVFDKEYQLANLKDVKTFIDQNHHLPEITSAAQIATEGINLGDMNAKLLKKIEELTLYLIEKENELSVQQRQLIKQQGLINAQQNQLNKIKKKLKID